MTVYAPSLNKHRPLNRKEIGQRIGKTRRDRGWRQCDLAKVIGVKTGTIALWETGIRLPRLPRMAAIAFVLQRKVDFFLFGGRDYWWRRKYESADRDDNIVGFSKPEGS